ncbi:MAG TPA: flagellar basal body-associated FliL family protein [Burkholderiaceae bacterium]|jgi:flagellar FliL protein|nr:flagellar basal body-associated FliL family protein [Burkholderiaceae bacterium]
MSAAAAAADAVPAKSGGKKKLVLMVAVAALVLGGGGVGALVYMKKQKAAAEAAAEEGDGDAGAGATAAAKPREKKRDKNEKPVFVPMDAFVVNLADHEADRYAQIGIVLEVPDEHAGEEIKTYLPAIRNNILLLLAHKSSTDLAGGDGKELLARQIRREALKAMGEDVDEDEDAAPAADGASAPAKRKKKKAAENEAAAPIRSVQFSSFIIQ